ncbi:MAG: hypothetical protein CM15mP54_19840 [Paracoccaceae bacterium]|nr:MAG: hypothetical protein CM15mP54_19840 [Paracoccaceae bacterium]
MQYQKGHFQLLKAQIFLHHTGRGMTISHRTRRAPSLHPSHKSIFGLNEALEMLFEEGIDQVLKGTRNMPKPQD